MKELQENIESKRHDLLPDNWVIHHENLRAHDVQGIREFQAKKLITKMDHPLNSSDFTTGGFGYFQNWKSLWKAKDLLTSVTFSNTWLHYWNVFQETGSKDVISKGYNFTRGVLWMWQQPIVTSQHTSAVPGIKLALFVYIYIYEFVKVLKEIRKCERNGRQ